MRKSRNFNQTTKGENMKTYKNEDVKINSYQHDGMTKTYRSISVDTEDFIEAPMWYHKRGLSQTANGYGKKLNTGKKLMFNGKAYRVYCSIFSNTGTCYIIVKKEHIVVS